MRKKDTKASAEKTASKSPKLRLGRETLKDLAPPTNQVRNVKGGSAKYCAATA